MQNSLFVFPIYGHSRDVYYKEHKVVSEKRKFKKQCCELLTSSQVENRMRESESSGWFDIPPWEFNNIVGYLDIGMDSMTSLTADIYLKRRNFPRNHRVRHSSYFTILQNGEFLYYAEIDKAWRIDIENNDSFVLALKEILKRVKKVIKERNKSFQFRTPSFDFKCFNFVEAYKNIKKINKL